MEENSEFRRAMLSNGIVPVNLMSLATNAANGIIDPWDGFRDLRSKHFRYIRNGFYSQSPLLAKRLDVEFFSALMYLRVLLEAGDPILDLDELIRLGLQARNTGQIPDELRGAMAKCGR